MNAAVKIMTGVFAVTAIVGVGLVAKCYHDGTCLASSKRSAEEGLVRGLAADVVRVAKEGTGAELRSWLLSHSPRAAEKALLAIDATLDPSSKARVVALGAVYSLGSEGLKDEATHEWGEVLENVAKGTLHDGPELADMIAKSFLMRGLPERAAAEYRRYPDHAASQTFFQQHPDLVRSPASN